MQLPPLFEKVDRLAHFQPGFEEYLSMDMTMQSSGYMDIDHITNLTVFLG